ncbi:MAG: amidohydrolase [Pseudomonadota bacterium]
MVNDRIIICGLILTMDPAQPMIRDGAVIVRNDTITWVGRADDLGGTIVARVMNRPKALMMPGLVNCHTHLPMALFRGLADDLPLDRWLNEHMFPAEAAWINPVSARQWALHSCREQLLSGVTTCCDGYFHEDAVAEAARESGIRAVLAQGIIDFPAPGVPDPTGNIDHAVAFAERWLGRDCRIRPSLFCHSPYTCSGKTLKRAKQAARSLGVLFQIHAAETRNEKSLIPGNTGLSPVAYLDSLGILDSDTLLVHCVWVDENDRNILKGTGAAVVHCPESNMKLASGIAPAPDLIRDGVRVGLGTDGSASNNNLDLFQEMNSASLLQKAAVPTARSMDDCSFVHMATLEGARALGMDETIGSITPGKKADIILVNMDQPHLVPMSDPWTALVHWVKGGDVMEVFVDGIHRVSRGRLIPG